MHKSWKPIVSQAYNALDESYRNFLENSTGYIPRFDHIFNAFSLPKEKTKYILFGQDPYPRKESAIGYAFIDGAVQDIFGTHGLSKEVNRATSLRNFIKSCLVAENLISSSATKEEIAKLNTKDFITSIWELKDNFLANGVLLLNMSLIFESKEKSSYHTKMWRPFIVSLLQQLRGEKIELILFGNISKEVDKLGFDFVSHRFEHPYNLSFINNREVHHLFSPMKLLYK